jgi:hypothetical protein
MKIRSDKKCVTIIVKFPQKCRNGGENKNRSQKLKKVLKKEKKEKK